MSRITLWSFMTIGAFAYLIAKVMLGFQPVRPALDTFSTAEYWVTATLVIQWIVTRKCDHVSGALEE